MGKLGLNSGYIGSDQRITTAGAVGYDKFYLERKAGRFNPVLEGDPDANMFFNRVIAAGGTLSATEKIATNQLVLDMKINGIWSSMKAIYPMVGASAAACAQNLKSSSFTGTFSSGWTFASTGITPNGTSAYMNTNFLTNNLSQNNNAIGFYSRTNIIASQTEIGITAGIPGTINMGANYLNAGAFARNFNSLYGGFTNTDTRGFYTNCRILSTENKMYKNGSVLGTILANSETPNSTINIALGGEMQSGNTSVFQFSSKELAFAFLSDGLDETQNINLYTIVQAFQTTLSRNV
jgi:hypothetical protein